MAPHWSALIVASVAAFVATSSALSEERLAELKEKLLPTLSECGEQHGMTLEKLAEFKLQKKDVDDSNKCFFACVYKKIGLLDNHGLYSEETALKYIAEHVDESKLEEAKENAKSCVSVNEEAVSDVEAGCDRAKLLYNCIIKNSALYGVDF